MKNALHWLRVHWLLWALPLFGMAVWCYYVWTLAKADVAAPDMPFIYDL